MRRRLRELRNWSSRRYPKHPLLGVGALIFKRDSILLVKRGRPPLKGYWSLPGGLVETGETLEAALLREVFEETGLRVKADHRVGIFERIIFETRTCDAFETRTRDAREQKHSGRVEYHYVLIDYVCRVVGGELQAGDDVSSAEWVPRARLCDYQLTEGTGDVIEGAFDDRRRRSSRGSGRKASHARGKRS